MSILMNDSENVEDKIKFEKRLHLIHNQSTLKKHKLKYICICIYTITCKFKPKECVILKVNSNVNYGLWII